MEITDIKIFLVSSFFFLMAEFIWNLFMLWFVLFLLRLKTLIFTKKFFYYIIYGAVVSLLTDRGFRFLILNIRLVNNFWVESLWIVKLGIMIVPILLLVVFHYFLASFIFIDLEEKDLVKLAIFLGILTAPWPTFLSHL